jgi:hypothetical protein
MTTKQFLGVAFASKAGKAAYRAAGSQYSLTVEQTAIDQFLVSHKQPRTLFVGFMRDMSRSRLWLLVGPNLSRAPIDTRSCGDNHF